MAVSDQAAPVAKWLRTLIFSALYRSSSPRCGFEPTTGHMPRQAKFCLRVVWWFFSGISRFRSTLRLTAQTDEAILMGNKTRIKSKKIFDQSHTNASKQKTFWMTCLFFCHDQMSQVTRKPVFGGLGPS